METNGYWVYTITTPEGMVYVGMSSRKRTCDRWQPRQYKTTSLQPFIEKFGWESLTHEVISTNMTKKEAQTMENELIEKYGNEGKRINKYGSGGWKKDEELIKIKKRESSARYREKHREECVKRVKEWREKHKSITQTESGVPLF